MKDYWELVERQVERTVAMLQEGRANYSIIVIKEEKMFSCWCRTDDDAMVLAMAAILLRTGRQDVERLVEVARQIDIDQIDEFVEENPDEDDADADDEEDDWQ